MDDLYYVSNCEEFYHTSHHIKELLREIQKADRAEEVDHLRFELLKNINHICKVKVTDMDEHNEHMAFILDMLEKGIYYGKKT